MRYRSQNLTADYLDRKERPTILAGRGWLYAKPESRSEIFHWEWALGPYARDFAAWLSFGYGDSDRGICLHLCFPFVFSVFLIFMHGPRVKECKTGIAIHNGSFWWYPLTDENEWRRDFPWWKKSHAWNFPWTLDWHMTEILSHDLKSVVWMEKKGQRNLTTQLGTSHEALQAREEIERGVSHTYLYQYELKSGEIQNRTATVYVDRMTWRARWWPIIPRQHTRTSINVSFSDEVGEGTGSWKGGCTGCGYEMLPGETPEQTLRRMERERKFTR